MELDAKEAALLRSILEAVSYEELPNKLKNLVSDKEYADRIISTCCDRNIVFGKVAKLAIKSELAYYQTMEQYCRERMRIYPYHLQERFVAIEVSPFTYYRKMLRAHLEAEKSYDQLPNFTAADVLRLTGIGRNEYIDLLNQSRSKKSITNSISGMLFRKTSISRLKSSNNGAELPSQPIDFELEPWWMVRVGYPTTLQIQELSAAAKITLDSMMDSGDKLFQVVKFASKPGFRELIQKEIVFIEIPVADSDSFRIPVLEGFVMNRLSGDYIESFLYKVFSTLSSQSVKELSELLEEDLNLVCQAVSTLNRLGFAEKDDENDEDSNLIDALSLQDSNDIKEDKEDQSKLALIYDSNLAALLMMGNLSAGLKKHAVTMFEVGQLRDDQIDALTEELRLIDDYGADGDAETYFEAGRALLLALEMLRVSGKVHMFRAETLNELPRPVIQKRFASKYSMIISMADINCSLPPLPSSIPFVGNPSGRRSNPWLQVLLSLKSPNGPVALVLPRGFRLRSFPKCLERARKFKVYPWEHDIQILSSSMGLYHLNEALIHHPIVLRNHSTDLPPVALPQSTEELSRAGIREDQLDTLAELVDPSKCAGYISRVELEGTTFIDAINFGIPLTSLELTAKVCDGMSSMDPNKIETHQKWDEQLSELMGKYGDNEDGAWPTKALLVCNGTIEFFDN